jgi:signal transduction histidine kinase
MKDEFLATVSHELRTPMTSMIGAMDLIAGGFAGELPAEAAELVTLAHENGRRLSSLIDDVLDVTKLQASGPSLRLQKLCLAPILAQAARANQGYASRAGVLLDYQAGPAEAAAQVDAERLMQVLANLLSNAVKHSPHGALVRLTLEDAGEHWAISVSDRGPGISPDFRPRLFERFAQADSSDRRCVAGTGLGLYITRMLVQRMKGEISVNSEAGKGATFTVHLPKA